MALKARIKHNNPMKKIIIIALAVAACGCASQPKVKTQICALAGMEMATASGPKEMELCFGDDGSISWRLSK